MQLRAQLREALAQRAVRGDATADRQGVVPGLREPACTAQRKRFDDRVLVGRRKVGAAASGLVLPEVAHLVEQRGLQPGEREVQPADLLRDREREGGRISVARELLERWAAGERKAEQPCALADRLACRIVQRLPQLLVAVMAADIGEEG